ncbi:MAG TPA: hypothetical protein VLF87_03985, partial [Patescibacteria group bacterium]|nr:hypothetical protein [Patescibacteria group bacterium]
DVEHGSLHDRLRQNASQAEPDQQPSVVEPVQERPSFEPGKFKTDTYEIDGHRVNKWQVSETMTALGQAVRDLHNAKPRRQAKVLRQIHQQFGNYLGADQMTASEVEQRLRDAHTQLFGAFSSIQGWSDQNRAQYYRRASNWMNGAKQDKLNVPINGLQVPEPTPVLPIREDEPYSVTAENLSSVVERLRNKGGVKSDQDRAELNGAVQAFADRRLNTPAAVNVDELLQRTQDLVASGPSRTRGRVKRLRTGVRNRAGRVAQNVRSRRNRGGDDEIDAEV